MSRIADFIPEEEWFKWDTEAHNTEIFYREKSLGKERL